MNRFVKAAMVALDLTMFSGCAMYREHMDKEYQRLCVMPDAVHQPMNCMTEIDSLDTDACVYLNLCLCHMRATVAESDYHRVGVAFESDAKTIEKEEGVPYQVAFAKVKRMILEEDVARPANEKIWPMVKTWLAAKKELAEIEGPMSSYSLSVYLQRLSQLSKLLSDASKKLDNAMNSIPADQRDTEQFKELQQRSAVVAHNQRCLEVVGSRLSECDACLKVELEMARRKMVLKYYSK